MFSSPPDALTSGSVCDPSNTSIALIISVLNRSGKSDISSEKSEKSETDASPVNQSWSRLRLSQPRGYDERGLLKYSAMECPVPDLSYLQEHAWRLGYPLLVV
jgi:hypothetical protein